MSPRPAAPSRASVTACSTTSASLWPTRPRGCSTRTPPKSSGRPSASRWVSCPMPTRMGRGLAGESGPCVNCSRGPPFLTTQLAGRSALERAADREVLEAHELLEIGQGDLAGRAVALLGDDDLDGALVLAGLVHLGAVQQHDGIRVL